MEVINGRILVRKPLENQLLERLRIWEDGMKMDLKGIL
jgi:hypothetical protein